MNLRETIQAIANNWERIPIRAKKGGKWGSYYLDELPDGTVTAWLRDEVLPPYLFGKTYVVYHMKERV